MEQLIVTPLKSYEFILGKTIPYIILSLGQMVAVIVLAIYWFEIPLNGSILLLFFATCLFFAQHARDRTFYFDNIRNQTTGHDDFLLFLFCRFLCSVVLYFPFPICLKLYNGLLTLIR